MEHNDVVYGVAFHLPHSDRCCLAWSSKAARLAVYQATRNGHRDKQMVLFYGFGAIIDEVVILNPATGQTQPLPDLPMHRSNPSIVVLKSSIFVCGGNSKSGLAVSQVDRFDTVGMRWVPTPSLSTSRTSMVAGGLNHILYVCGGADRDNKVLSGHHVWRSAERFDVASNRWMDLPAMIEERVGAAAVIIGHFLYVLGGQRGDGHALNSVERLDLLREQWQSLPPMSEYRRFRRMSQDATIAVVGKHLYVCDGMLCDTANLVLERLDTASLAWEVLQPPPMMCHNTAFLSCRGYLYACGGKFVKQLHFGGLYPCCEEAYSEIQRFDPALGQWTVVANMEWSRYDCLALASAGFVYVFGGSLCHRGQPQANMLPLAECFDTDTNQRSTLRSSRLDLEGNRRGILGACMCGMPPYSA